MRYIFLCIIFFEITFAQYPGWQVIPNPPETKYNVTKIACDTNNNLWIGESNWTGKIYQYDGVNWKLFNTEIFGSISAMYVDKSNNVWVGSQVAPPNSSYKLAKYNGTSWEYFRFPGNDEMFYKVNSFSQDRNNNILIATERSGLFKFDGMNWTNYNKSNSGIKYDEIKTIVVDSLNNYWFSYTDTAFVSKYNGNTWVHYLIAGNGRSINSLVVARSEPDSINRDGVWVGVKAFGDSVLTKIYRNGNVEQKYGFLSIINPNEAYSLAYANDQIWVGTNKGMVSFNEKNYIKKYYTTTNSALKSNIVYSIIAGKNKVKYILAGTELYKYDETPFVKLTALPDSVRSETNYQIKWNAGFLTTVSISYTTNNGGVWTPIASVSSSPGSYSWQVPVMAPPASQCKIKISANSEIGSLVDESSIITIYAKVSNPTLTPPSGIYTVSQNVLCNESTIGAEVRYTLDGTEPTKLSSLYSQAFKIDSTQSVKLRAFKNDWVASDIVSYSYTMKCANPVFTPSAAAYSTPQSVSILSTTDAAKIYFTLDGSEPTENSNLYVSPLTIDTNKTLKAKVYKNGWSSSNTQSGNYTIARQVITTNFNLDKTWLDIDFNGKESRTIRPTITISYGTIVERVWSVGSTILGTDSNIVAELPTGTWNIVLAQTTNRGIVIKDSIKISVYASEVSTFGAIESGVSQLNQNVYFVTSKGGNIYQFDSTGLIAWTIQTGGSIQSTTCVSGQDNIYVGSNDTRLYSFDYHGSPRWDKAMGGTILSSPSVGSDSTIYIGISTGRFFALDEKGTIKWNVQTSGAINSSAAIDNFGRIYFGSNDGKLYSVSDSGKIIWNYQSGGPIKTSPAIGRDSSIVFGSDDGYLYKVSQSGVLKWKYQTSGGIKSSPIIGLNGKIYFGSGDGKVYSLSQDGIKLWEYNAGSPVNTTPALSIDGSIYFGALNGQIISLDGTGNKKWILETNKPIVAPILVTSSQLLMVGDTLGKVYIMKAPLNGILPKNGNNSSAELFEWATFKGNNQRTGKLTSPEKEAVAVVYSGDSNNDGRVDIADILPIGQYFGLKGMARQNASTSWVGQSLYTAWTPFNACFADCDGNGTVETQDVVALIQNWNKSKGLIMPFEPNQIAASEAIIENIDRQSDNYTMSSIRNTVIEYMKNTLGVVFNFSLDQNYPNPFNPTTTIRFVLSEKALRTNLSIYNIAGQKVFETTMSELDIGNHTVQWNGTTLLNEKVSSGMYIYELRSNKNIARRKMLLLK